MQTKKQKSSKRMKKQQKTRNLTDGLMAPPTLSWGIPKTIDRIIPDRMVTRLTYKGFTTFQIAAAGQVFSRRWIPTALYDVDPLLGSTTTVGFTEMSAFYGTYRVYKSKVIVRFVNTSSSQPLQGVVIPLNQDPGASPSVATTQSWENNAYSKVKLLPCVGADPVTIVSTMSTEKIYGSKMVYFDDNFAANVTTTPVNNWYWVIGILSPVALGSAINVTVEVDIIMDAEFYNRRVMLN